MKKFRGKALATLLSLALVASSLPVTLASASTRNSQGRLTTDPENDEFWLVNGGTSTDLRSVHDFDGYVYGTIPLVTKDREAVDDIELSSISHVSGDRVCKWDIDDDNDGDTTLSLRKSDSEGTEVLAILYKGTYTDDDDNDITVKASTKVTIHAVDKYATVIGDASFSDPDVAGTESPELDDDFAVQTMDGTADSKELTVFRAEPTNNGSADESKTNVLAKWTKMTTVEKDSENDPDADNGINEDSDDTNDVYYTIKTSNDNIELANTTTGAVTATVADDKTGNVTFTAEATKKAVEDENVADDDDIKVKVKIAKKILVNTTDTSFTIYDDDGDTMIKANGDGKEIDGGYEVNFNNDDATVTVGDDANLDSVTGTLKTLDINEAKIDTIDLDAGAVAVEDDDAKVGNISTDGASNVTISANVTVGDIDVDGAGTVKVESGSVGAISTDDKVEITGNEDETTVSTGVITAKTVDIDSDDGKVSVDGIVSAVKDGANEDTTIALTGDDVSVKSIDFDYYATDVQFNDFQGEISAPKNATTEGAMLETMDSDSDVTVIGNVDVDSISIEDESTVKFADKVSVNNLDGSGTMYIGADKLYVGDDASGVIVKITDSNLKADDTIFTADSDAVDEDDLDFYGFTVKKDEGKNTDTFKVDQLSFAGLMMNKTASKVVLGDSETFTASAYAPGTSLPEGYSVEFDMEDNSGVFEVTDNGNGTATVKVVDYDETFSDENKATLEAYLVDEDGDEDDDYEVAECDVTALKVPERTFVSDTNNDFSIAPGASYQFKITASAAPAMVAGTAGVLNVTNVGKSGNDYFIKVTAAANAAGKETGLYVNGTKLLVVKVAGTPSFVSDTTAAVKVAKGASYQYKITAATAPSFTLGTAGVFNYTLVSHNGNNYFYKVTAVGAAGAQTGVYVNGQKVNVATVA
ncbi:MAG: hypothetical protein LKJ17_09100 [Oscillospiraceae bacterium]|jgi:hypothetical protein|nr:hypothetical protein [Oscillospiraceae bacterium]